ncbi:hypothetical protein PCANB_001987 [Pneumocystis canis]|nr:hypothetical protein PCK1_001737 [Pneumocystis canis]KAG5439413.1 hypothetical protein PCANB_001987 [Pneumocystis canis]
MRESNFCSPSQNRAAVSITSGLYDRRALDCTAVLPLVNSLSHLSFLTSTSSRIREILAEDEGLERLVRLLQEGRYKDRLEAWKWQLAFQCVVNVGIRGSENVRTRVVEANVVPVIATVLDEFLQRLEYTRSEIIRDVNGRWLRHNIQDSINEEMDEMSFIWHTPSLNIDIERRNGIRILRTISMDSDDANSDEIISTNYNDLRPLQHPPVDLQTLQHETINTSLSVMPVHSIENHDQNTNTMNDESALLSHSYSFHSLEENSAFSNTMDTHGENEMHLSNTIHENHVFTASPAPQPQPLLLDSRHFFFKNENNVVFCLQLLAYISKYPQLRSYFQNSHDIPKLRYYHTEMDDAKVMPMNVFALVERFTLRIHPAEVQYWAGVIMRNTCRKDESRGGIRQCAYIDCGRWESFNRQFAKCRRCRRTKYCSKQCQSRAWPGHRWWCRERSTN